MTFPGLWVYVTQKLLRGMFEDFLWELFVFDAVVLLYIAGLLRHRHPKRSWQSVVFVGFWNVFLSVITFLIGLVILAALFAVVEVLGGAEFVMRYNFIIPSLVFLWVGSWFAVTLWLGVDTSRTTRRDPDWT